MVEQVASDAIERLLSTLLEAPPPGLNRRSVESFAARFKGALVRSLATLLRQELETPIERLDRTWRGRWHKLSAAELPGKLDSARRDGSIDWLLTRLPVHRPDLAELAKAWAVNAQISLPPAGIKTRRPIPVVREGRLEIAETEDDGTRNPDALARSTAGFERFATLASENTEIEPNTLRDIAIGYFQRSLPDAVEPTSDETRKWQRLLAWRNADAADWIAARKQLLDAAGIVERREEATASQEADSVEPEQLLAALLKPEPQSAEARTDANIAALRILQFPPEPGDWRQLIRYTGWGGLSLDRVRDDIPPRLLPSSEGLVHEYYTPARLTLAIAEILRPWVESLPSIAGTIQALEPSAGVGRFVNALSTPGFEKLSWTAVETSPVAASILARIRPEINTVNLDFEEFVQDAASDIQGTIGLIVANPPYGARGASYTKDKDKRYRENKAYVYFLRRCLDLLAPGGVGVFIVPYGFLSGKAAPQLLIREKVLKRHHLRFAFRLPSSLFPGANIVTDCIFFEARGGELAKVQAEDEYILTGDYFLQHPGHILGTEQGAGLDTGDEDASRAYRYSVIGDFTGFPAAEPRLRCTTCAVAPFAPRTSATRKVGQKRAEWERLSVQEQTAVTLGRRVRKYLRFFSSGEQSDLQIAAAQQPELKEALLAWATSLGTSAPNTWTADNLSTEYSADVGELRAAFTDSGVLLPAIMDRPAYQPAYSGQSDNIVAQAEFYYSQHRRMSIEDLVRFRRDVVGVESIEPLEPALVAAGWAFDDGGWMPGDLYYTGNLWERYERAKAAAQAGDQIAAKQQAELALLIRVKRIEDIDPEPRCSWLPAGLVQKWIEHYTGTRCPRLHWEDGLLTPIEIAYSELSDKNVKQAPIRLALGYINHDLAYFKPKYNKRWDPDTGEEETAEAALDRARLEYHAAARTNFNSWILASSDLATDVETAYNRLFRGYVTPKFGSDPIPLARWGSTIVLKPHQNAGARRLFANNGGLLGFDVGVGKTYTGIAVVAWLRQIGKARRPVVLVPNTIVWKWYKDILRCLPDYRVLVIGSVRSLNRDGAFASRIDTPEERSAKWRQFQAGLFDVVLVTYSVFGRTSLRDDTVRRFGLASPPVLRRLMPESRELAELLEANDDDPEVRVSKRELEKAAGGADALAKLTEQEERSLISSVRRTKLEARLAELQELRRRTEDAKTPSERQRAINLMSLDRWVAMQLETNYEPDPGIYWEDLNVDALFVDEAQNFKNLWPVGTREGGLPKYLGAIQEGSDRSYALALRASVVREKNGGSGVYLLSATPAKNSPLEYFALLGYVDGNAWTGVGILDPQMFIDRYLRLEQRTVVNADLSMKNRSVVAGFKTLDEFREIVFRFCEFRTAAEVGLRLPDSKINQVFVPLDPRQERKYAIYADKYREALKGMSGGPGQTRARMAALGYLQKMALIAIHAELDKGPGAGSDDDEDDEATGTGWNWRNASKVTDPHCPKLDFIVDKVSQEQECGSIIFCDNIAVHRWLHMLLVEAGVPEARIAILNGEKAKDPAVRQSIAERFNGVPAVQADDGTLEQEAIAPEFDIVIANAVAYEGIDLHVRTCRVYHVDLPWEPATLQQRNGRAVRQGNTRAVVEIYFLLSERSLDAVRLSMISGKLGWMKDLLESAERETNNPAAGSDMSGEEMVLMLARDPEEAKAAIAAQKELLAEEGRRRVREQAWVKIRGIIQRINVLAKISDAAEVEVIEAEIREFEARLTSIPSEVWDWHFLTDMLRRRHSLYLGQGWALPSDHFVGGARAFATGKVTNSSIGVRAFGTAKFLPLDSLAPNWEPPTPSNVRAGPSTWNASEDAAGFEAELINLLSLPSGRIQDLGLDLASGEWRRYLWGRWEEIKAGVRRAGKNLEFGLPNISGDVLTLVEPDQVDTALNLLPWTDEGYTSLLRVAATSGIRYSDLNETCIAWWGRPFPRGILRTKAPTEPITIHTKEGSSVVVPVFVDRHLAVIQATDQDPSEPPRWTIIHVPSGRAAARQFFSDHAAEIAIGYANRMSGIDWSTSPPNLGAQRAHYTSAMAHIRDTGQLPSEDQIRAWNRL